MPFFYGKVLIGNHLPEFARVLSQTKLYRDTICRRGGLLGKFLVKHYSNLEEVEGSHCGRIAPHLVTHSPTCSETQCAHTKRAFLKNTRQRLRDQLTYDGGPNIPILGNTASFKAHGFIHVTLLEVNLQTIPQCSSITAIAWPQSISRFWSHSWHGSRC